MWNALGLKGAAVAAVLTVLALWLLQPIAHRLNLLDHPKGRKDHAHPTPITGGLAMAAAVLVCLRLFLDTSSNCLPGFLLAASIVTAVGLLDDRHDLHWRWRIAAQVAAALVMIYVSGVRIENLGAVFGVPSMPLGGLSVPFTVFATVGLINAINMIDGADGLAGLLVAGALVMLAAAAAYAGNDTLAPALVIICGAVTGFLAFNLRHPWRPRAKLFMGNAGSAFLGLVIAWTDFSLTQNPGHPVNPVLALWILPVPVIDTLALMFHRLRGCQSPFIADRNHIHHLMLEAGFGPTQAGLVLTGASLCTGLLAGLAMRADVPNPCLLATFALLLLLWIWITARRERAIALFSALRRFVPTIRPRYAQQPLEQSVEG